MKQVTTILCSLAFLIAGIFLAATQNAKLPEFSKHQTISAATLSAQQISMLPLDVQLDLGKETQLTDSVKIKTDTIYIDRPQVLVINKKNAKASPPKRSTDFTCMFLNPGKMSTDTVNNKRIPDREENTGETDVGVSKTSSIQLIVDGQTVYSKNDNHSTGEPQ